MSKKELMAGSMFQTAPKKFDAWSWSRLADYELCPAKAKFKHLDKFPDPGGPAMQRGSLIHKTAEVFATAKKRDRCPDELKRFESQFRMVQQLNVMTEERLGLTEKWEPTGFFGAGVWLRQVLDLSWIMEQGDGTAEMDIVDHKTGKMRGGYEDQLELYAVSGFATHADVMKIRTQLWYLDQGEAPEMTFHRKDFPTMKKRWAARVKPMFADTVFKPNPSADNCRFCPFSKSKGGPCKF